MTEVLEGQEVSASSGRITLPNHASRCRPTHHAASDTGLRITLPAHASRCRPTPRDRGCGGMRRCLQMMIRGQGYA